METLKAQKEQKIQPKKNNSSFFKPAIQKKLSVGSAKDSYEVEANQVADKVMKMSEPASNITHSGALVQRKCAHCEQEEKLQMKPLAESISPLIQRSSPESGGVASDHVESQINSSKGGGSVMDSGTKTFMENRFGTDFSDVKIHTGSQAVQMSRELNAQAFTVGNDIYFNEGKYSPNSDSGKHLLAHELTHTVQQGGGESSISQKVQRTEVGDILDEFFSPFSTERLWVMQSGDNYTTRVIAWQPVIDELNIIKNDIRSNCSTWASTHRTDASWVPGMSFSPDPHSFGHLVAHPSGTDPGTCASAFIIYNSLRGVIFSPRGPQTDALYTCSIGSFNLRVTVDFIDCTANNAVLNIWMYNNMSQTSFGQFTSLFPLSGMQNQHMWWHWNESITWPVPTPVPVPIPAPTLIPGPVNGSVTASRLNIRARPNTYSAIVGSYPRNAAISVICQTTGFVVNGNNVWYQTDRGFVSGRYVALGGSATPRYC